MQNKVCFTTYIFGEAYQDYIPFVIYTVYKSYPQYDTILFINGKLRKDVEESLAELRKVYNGFQVIENTFDDCPKMNPLKSQSLRWVLWTDKFREYDYLYYIDVDMLYLREDPTMDEQHVRHMKYIGSDCVSNIVRKKPLKFKEWYQAYLSYKHGGLVALFKYAFTPFIYRMSGIHFVKVKEYFNYITPDVMAKYKKDIYSSKVFRKTVMADNEAMLYNMMKEAGIDMSVFAVQRSSSSMFGFQNPEKREFCPHHGIHMGIFRAELSLLKDWCIEQLESDDYQYYKEKYKTEYVNDPLFQKILNNSSERVRYKFGKLNEYYGIKADAAY